MSTAVVVAAPERKRILRELLSRPEPWSIADRELYRHMLWAELEHCSNPEFTEVYGQTVASAAFRDMFIQGVPVEQAREQAAAIAEKAVRNHRQENSPGRHERKRRRAFKEAVTASAGGLAVTLGEIEACFVCHEPIPASRRGDRAYCSDRCRQAAYRKRKRAQVPTPSLDEVVSEREKILATARKVMSPAQMKHAKMVASLSHDEFEAFVNHHQSDAEHLAETRKTIRALRQSPARRVDGCNEAWSETTGGTECQH